MSIFLEFEKKIVWMSDTASLRLENPVCQMEGSSSVSKLCSSNDICGMLDQLCLHWWFELYAMNVHPQDKQLACSRATNPVLRRREHSASPPAPCDPSWLPSRMGWAQAKIQSLIHTSARQHARDSLAEWEGGLIRKVWPTMTFDKLEGCITGSSKAAYWKWISGFCYYWILHKMLCSLLDLEETRQHAICTPVCHDELQVEIRILCMLFSMKTRDKWGPCLPHFNL